MTAGASGLKKAQAHYDTTVGGNLEAPVKGGNIQNLDHMHERHIGHSDSVTSSHPVLNLKVGQMNYIMGYLYPDWAKPSKRGQNLQEVGKKKYS